MPNPKPAARNRSETVWLNRFDTEMGPVTLASTAKGVVACSLPGKSKKHIVDWLARKLPDAEVVEGTAHNRVFMKAVRDYLSGRRRELDLPLDLRGTPFQKRVWAELCKVPFGETITYAALAKRAGHPRAVRACGSANGANPIPLIVPCHRVIASDGTLGGFGGGLPLKRRLLDLEGSPAAHS